MLNVNNDTKNAYYDDTLLKTLVISFPNKSVTFTGDDILGESVKLIEKIETERSLTFKGCIASKFTFKVADNVIDLRGEYLEATIQADETEVIPLFSGYVDDQDNETREDIVTTFTCYDPLYKIGSRNMQSWVDGLSFPITVRNFRNSLFSNLGITQEARTLINDNLTISANFKSFVDAPSATDIMKWICQLNGVYGQYGRDKKFHYRELNALSEGTYPAEDLYPGEDTFPSAENAGVTINTSDYVSLTYEPYTTDYITKVVIIDGGGLDQGQAGVEGNTFIVQDNPIAFNVNMQSAARALLAKINVVNHIPVIKMKCVGLPYVECGDTFLSYTRKNVCRSYVLQRTLSGIQALFDEYSSDSDKDYPPYKATTKSMTNADRKKILQIQSDIVRIDGKIIADEAEFNTLKSKAITTDNLSAQNISANQITAGTLNVDRIQAGSISAQKLNVSASDGNGWNVSMGPGGTSFSKGSLGTGNITGALGTNKSGWGVNFGGYGDQGSLTVGQVTADMITTNVLNSKIAQIGVLTTQNLSCGGYLQLHGRMWGTQQFTYINSVNFVSKTYTTRTLTVLAAQG